MWWSSTSKNASFSSWSPKNRGRMAKVHRMSRGVDGPWSLRTQTLHKSHQLDAELLSEVLFVCFRIVSDQTIMDLFCDQWDRDASFNLFTVRYAMIFWKYCLFFNPCSQHCVLFACLVGYSILWVSDLFHTVQTCLWFFIVMSQPLECWEKWHSTTDFSPSLLKIYVIIGLQRLL